MSLGVLPSSPQCTRWAESVDLFKTFQHHLHTRLSDNAGRRPGLDAGDFLYDGGSDVRGPESFQRSLSRQHRDSEPHADFCGTSDQHCGQRRRRGYRPSMSRSHIAPTDCATSTAVAVSGPAIPRTRLRTGHCPPVRPASRVLPSQTNAGECPRRIYSLSSQAHRDRRPHIRSRSFRGGLPEAHVQAAMVAACLTQRGLQRTRGDSDGVGCNDAGDLGARYQDRPGRSTLLQNTHAGTRAPALCPATSALPPGAKYRAELERSMNLFEDVWRRRYKLAWRKRLVRV